MGRRVYFRYLRVESFESLFCPLHLLHHLGNLVRHRNLLMKMGLRRKQSLEVRHLVVHHLRRITIRKKKEGY